MKGYVVSRFGTFGVVHREYTTEDGVPMVVIRWGPQAWLTPVKRQDVIQLNSSYQTDAWAEAAEALEALEEVEK